MIKIISVIIVMLCINAFMAFAVVKAAGRLDNAVRQYFVTKVGTADYSRLNIAKNSIDYIFTGEEGEGEEGGVGTEEGEQQYYDADGNPVKFNMRGQKQVPSMDEYTDEVVRKKRRQSDSVTEEVDGAGGKGEGGGKGNGNGSGEDGLFGGESGEKEEVLKEVETFGSPVQIPVMPNLKAVRYKNDELRDEYKLLRQMTSLDKLSAVNVVRQVQDYSPETDDHPYASVLDVLDYETAFRLSTLDSDVQEQLLRETFDPAQTEILDNYLASTFGSFAVLEFYGYVQEQSQLNDPVFYVHTGSETESFTNPDGSIATVFDDEIAEGIKIVYKNRMYDYSV